jgi:hypothetical protein
VPTPPGVKASSLTPSQLAGTIAELERMGFTHVRVQCGDCGHEGLTSFFLMRTRRTVAEDTTFLELAHGIKCAKCRQKPSPDAVRPVHRTEMTGAPAPRKVRRDSL